MVVLGGRRDHARLAQAIDKVRLLRARLPERREVVEGDVVFIARLAVRERPEIDGRRADDEDALARVLDAGQAVDRAADDPRAGGPRGDLDGRAAVDVRVVPVEALVMDAVLVDVPAVLSPGAGRHAADDVVGEKHSRGPLLESPGSPLHERQARPSFSTQPPPVA